MAAVSAFGDGICGQAFDITAKFRISGKGKFLQSLFDRLIGEGTVHKITDVVCKYFPAVLPCHQIAEERGLVIVQQYGNIIFFACIAGDIVREPETVIRIIEQIAVSAVENRVFGVGSVLSEYR